MTTEQEGFARWSSSARGRSTLLLSALGAVVIAVLLHGAARRRSPGPGAATPAPEPSAPSLRADLEKTPLSYLSDYWLQLGSRVRARLVLVGPRKTPALVVAPDLAVSTIDAADASAGEVLEEVSDAASYRPLAADATVGLALFEVSPSLPDTAFRPADPASLRPGMLVAAISVDPRDKLTVMPGHLLSAPGSSIREGAAAGTDSLDAFVPLAPSTRAAAIVDLDGNLVGAIFRHNKSTRVLSAESLMKAVARLRAQTTCRSIEVGDLDQAVRRMVGVESGVVVEKVAPEAFRPEPSIRPGDVLLEWNGHAITSAAEFGALHGAERPGTLVAYLLRRGRRVVRGGAVVPGPDCRPPVEQPVALPKTGLTLAVASAGEGASAPWRVAAVKPGSPAQSAGVEPGDSILSAGGSRPDSEEVLRGLRAFETTGQAIALTLQRGDRVKLVALRPEGR